MWSKYVLYKGREEDEEKEKEKGKKEERGERRIRGEEERTSEEGGLVCCFPLFHFLLLT